MSSEVALNVPQAVGKRSESIKELMEEMDGSFLGKERSCIMRSLDELGFGTSPIGEVAKGPMRASNSAGRKPREYLPASCSDWI